VGADRTALGSGVSWKLRTDGEPLVHEWLERDLKMMRESNPQIEPWRARLQESGTALQSALIHGDEEAAQNAAWNLLGLGPGLTPAGDDMLVGLLAGFHVLVSRVSG